uniref:Serine/threonine-protein phosphatase 6 regulatory subunit 1 n=1 Tax=Ascaris suum TaxID=6253 RepID=F1KU64_ASCSU
MSGMIPNEPQSFLTARSRRKCLRPTMFWQTDLAASSGPTLDDLLNAETVELDQVLLDEFTIQEIRNGHEKLLDYLTSPPIIDELVVGALRPHIDKSLPEKEHYKRAHQCAEILSLNNEALSMAMLKSDESRKLLVNFLADENINNLTASFYMKIVTQLLSKCTEQFLEELNKSNFLSLCLKRMKYSAVAELLYRIVNVPSEVEQQFFIRQWYAENHLAEGLNDLLVPEQLPEVHDNVGYLWSELVRVLREVQYTAEDKRRDALMESLQSERNVRILVSRMLPDDSTKHSDSVKINAAAILITLLETNFVPNCPSHQLGTEERGDSAQWIGGTSSGENELNGTLVWQPDAGRVVETVVAGSTDRIVKAILESLQRSDGEMGALSDSWCALMQLLVQVLNTNHTETHQAVLAAFSSFSINPMHLLFAAVFAHPLITIFHQQLARVVAFILYTASADPSPLIAYLIKDVDVLGQILNAYDSSQSPSLEKLARMALRTFYINLAIVIRSARISSPNAATIDRLIRETEKALRWDEFLKTVVTPYEEANRSDDVGAATAGVDVGSTKVDNTETPPIHVIAQQAAVEFSQNLMTSLLPENTSVPFPSSSVLAAEYDIPLPTIDLNLKRDCASIADEASFESLCELRIDTNIVAKRTSKDVADSWPGASEPQRTEKVNGCTTVSTVQPFAVSWDEVKAESTEVQSSAAKSEKRGASPAVSTNIANSPKLGAEDLKPCDASSSASADLAVQPTESKTVVDDSWPSSSTTSSENADTWANFSMKTSDWPPKGEYDDLQKDDSGWPSANESEPAPFPTHIPGLPVADGLACAIISGPVMEKPTIDADSSEC